MIDIESKVSLAEGERLRLDLYLITQLDTSFSRSRLKEGLVLLTCNNKNAKLSSRVKNGDRIHFQWKNPIPSTIKPEEIDLHIVYEDGNLMVLNKVQGMVVHPAHGNWSGTLVNALLFHWGREAIQKEASLLDWPEAQKRPGIVHRLDKDTSGLIITAKNAKTEAYLKKQFKKHAVIKQYIAITKGHPPFEKGTIKTQIMRDPNNPQKYIASTDESQGKFAHTDYICIALYGPYALMKIRIKTGRTHQIRVHMKYINCPILGDPLYGVRDSRFKTATLMLHASKLGIRLPEQKQRSLFKAATPIRFKKVLQVFHKEYERNSMWMKKHKS